MRRRWPGRLVLGLGLALAGAVSWWALREQPAEVDTLAVVVAPMRVDIRQEGKTRVRDVYTVSSPIAGHLARTVLQEGDPVQGGRTVVAAIHPLDPPLIDSRTEAELLAARDAALSGVGIAEGELKRAETALQLAKTELERTRKLFTPGIVSQSAVERVTNEVALATAAVEAARAAVSFRRAELASAEARLAQRPSTSADGEDCCVSLLAPVTGTVLAMNVRSEQAVAPGTVIAEIGDTTKLEIVVDLLSTDAVQLGPGSSAHIVDWGGDRALKATVRRIDPAAFTKVSALGIEEQRVNVILDFDEHDARLGHGFRVVAELTVWECQACLQVPIAALFRVAGQWQVFRLTGGFLRQTPVGIGWMNERTAQVLQGVSSGDVVVVHPSDTLVDGAPAKPRE